MSVLFILLLAFEGAVLFNFFSFSSVDESLVFRMSKYIDFRDYIAYVFYKEKLPCRDIRKPVKNEILIYEYRARKTF